MESNGLERSLWRQGKEDYKKFMNAKLSRRSNGVSFLMGLVFAAIIILPFTFIVAQIIELYWYNRSSMTLFLLIAWVMLSAGNGLSNYIAVKMVKAYNKDMDDIQNLDDKAIWFYHTLNPGFMIFTFAIMAFFWVQAV